MTEDRYTYRVTWSEEDSEHVGLCAEFPSLSWLASTPEAALKGIRSVVGDAVADMAASAEPRPEPLAAKQYSGRLVVRVPPGLHRRLALEAAEAGVSLNRLASAKLILQPYLARGRSPTAPKRLTGRSQRAANPRDS
ncbi:MAG: toxin-antitoxin system HicB family antitoxin, partial [Armatimonadetes bacterium]|nr:toxin-antitoxin system HicB family antitoxin [Armatimonadota bacterium]